MALAIQSRDFIKMMCPLLNIKQEAIRKMTIEAGINSVTTVTIQCFPKLGVEPEIVEITDDSDNFGPIETRRYIVTVEEVK